jgi:hypothetical protein
MPARSVPVRPEASDTTGHSSITASRCVNSSRRAVAADAARAASHDAVNARSDAPARSQWNAASADDVCACPGRGAST